jgi:hypothetical protein
MSIEQIQKEFPNLAVKNLQGGCNIYLPNETILTFWFKKRKWKSNKHRDWRRFADTQDVFNLISGLGNIEIKKSVIQHENALKNTTQLCIDHIKKKVATIENVKPNNGVIMILKTITLELEQFL